MSTKSKKQEAVIQDCYRNLPPDEKPIFVDIIEFVGRHPESGKLLSEAVTKGHEELSEIFVYMLDNSVAEEKTDS